MSDEIRTPWANPGPTDPVERAAASGLELDGDQFMRVKPIEGSTRRRARGRASPGRPTMTALGALPRQPPASI